MNIQQIQEDRKNGVMVGRVTYAKLIEAAYEMQQALEHIRNYSVDMDIVTVADEALKMVQKR